MKHVFLIAGIALCTSLTAQNTIKGTYDVTNETFTFHEGYAIITKNDKMGIYR